MHPATRALLCALCVLVCAGPLSARASAQSRDSRPGGSVDAAKWDRVLVAHARAGGVDYAGLRADENAMRDLHAFVASLATMREDAPLSAWLNAYNATVVEAVVSRYPIASVRDVPDFFRGARHRVAGAARTLDAIENEIIRPRFHDARVHAALSCAARGCPPLHGRAFAERDLDATLDRLARGMVASRRHVARAGDALRVSEIFFWFHEDFERDGGSVIGWLRRHDAGHRLDGVPDGVRLERIAYDWRLNDRPPRAAR